MKNITRNFRTRRSFKRRKGAGRTKKLNQALKTAIRNKIKAFPWPNCSQIARDLNSEVCTETIRQYLRPLNYIYKRPCKKPKLTLGDIEERFNWASWYKRYGFSQVVFADEASFWLNNNIEKMWIKKGEEYLLETMAHPQKVNVFGYITVDGTFLIETFQENLNAKLLVLIMQECLTRRCNRLFGRDQWALAYDNVTMILNRAEETQNYLKKN